VTIESRTISLHGHELTYRTAGEGPLLLLVHGMAGSSATWEPVLRDLARAFTVVAPDLLGHGQSDKPRGDYSLGAFASTLRDVMAVLGREHGTVIGQSLGGGIALQFAYQYPERCERLVLVGSGGLGDEVSILLRALTLPASEYVLPLVCNGTVNGIGATLGGWLGRLGIRPAPAAAEILRAYESLGDAQTREAFVHTLRAVVDFRGQRVSAADRLYLASEMPMMIVWGDRDPIIPVEHAYATRDAVPGSRLEIFEGAGHFLHVEQPVRFAGLLRDFIASTEPAHRDLEAYREALQTRAG
jgi:pimeloyl-ACP methyl ester carboxylesterase